MLLSQCNAQMKISFPGLIFAQYKSINIVILSLLYYWYKKLLIAYLYFKDHQSEHSEPLRYITLVGCCLSLLGLVITLILHIVLWRFVTYVTKFAWVLKVVKLQWLNIIICFLLFIEDFEVTQDSNSRQPMYCSSYC